MDALVTVFQAVITFALGALEAAFYLLYNIVHVVRFVLYHLHLAIASLNYHTLVKIHPSIHMQLDSVKELCAECALVMIKGDRRVLLLLGVCLNIFISCLFVEESLDFEAKCNLTYLWLKWAMRALKKSSG